MKFLLRAAILPMAMAASLANAQTAAHLAPQQNPVWDSGTAFSPGDDSTLYDVARVTRVQRVNNYSTTMPVGRSAQRCYTDGGGYTNDNAGDYPRNDGYGNYGNRYPNNAYGNNGYSNGYNTGYPNNGYRSSSNTGTGRTIASVVGSVVGAVVGSQIGGGSGRYLGTAVGSVLGGVAATGVYDNAQRNRERRPQVTVCDPVPVGSDPRGSYPRDYGRNNDDGTWYDVTYEYRGRTYTDRLPYNPGRELRVRVDVRPI